MFPFFVGHRTIFLRSLGSSHCQFHLIISGHTLQFKHPLMSPTSRISLHQPSAASLSGGGRGGPVSKLQFPSLPQEWEEEWEGRYVPGQMYKYQASLPKLPVPPLKQTLEKHITSVEPILSGEELKCTKAVVAEFGRPGGTGEKLQKLLEKRAEEKDSWLHEWWVHVNYLGNRQPLVFHSSPGIGFCLLPAKDVHQLVRSAARMILSRLKWNLLIQHEAIPPDTYQQKPMCMFQCDMLSKCRIPCPGVDRIRHTPIYDSRHIIVMRNGHFFRLDLMYECPDGTLAAAPSRHIIDELHNIIKLSSDPSEYPVGILTSEQRDTWTESRERLAIEPMNRHSLDVIETAQFVVCLDKVHPHISHLKSPDRDDMQDYHKTISANNVLHGNGSQQNSCNRWFDHAIQLIISEDGGIGFLLEHSVADTLVVVSEIFAAEMINLGYDVLDEPSIVPASALCPAEKLQWKLSTNTVEDIQAAKKNLDILVDEVDHRVMTFEDFGKNVPKMFKLSPDGFIQNAIQLAYYRLYGHLCATHEAGVTRQFLKGRTDSIRSCTNAALTFVKAMVDPAASAEEKVKSMAAAVKAHSDYARDAMNGQAVDRHLLGLRLIAQEAGMEVPELFKDEAYLKCSNFCLSTSSSLGSVGDNDMHVCAGRVLVSNGYGLYYLPQDQRITFTVVSYSSCPETDSELFGAEVMKCMREMQAVLVAANNSIGLSSKL